jgi:hypothetical protein
LVGVTGVTSGNASDRERKGKRNMHGVSVCAETDFTAHEAFKGTQQGVIARTPRLPNPLGSLSGVYVTSALNSKATVNLVTAMDA